MRLTIPDFSLVLMMGASGAGKSTFAAKHFLPTEIISSDRCRGFVADDEADQSATSDAFDVLYYIASKRLAARRLTVLDATNLRAEDRKRAIELARKYHALPVIFAFDIAEGICTERNRSRPDRDFGAHVVRNHVQLLRRSLRGLQREGFRSVHTLTSPEAMATAEIVREPLFTDRRADAGPFDIIGDVHGCLAELTELLARLGYAADSSAWRHPDGRRAIFLGDLVDRGPDSPGVLRLVMDMVAAGTALCVQGNHDNKLLRKLSGREVQMTHGLPETLAQLAALGEAREAFVAESRIFLDGLRSHYWLDAGKLVVAHAGLPADMHGRGSGAVRSFARYGETTGETDDSGLPVRYEWARDYRGKASVVYGHTPVASPEWLNQTLCIDTGCVYGGALTALRYPERGLVSVPAHREYVAPVRSLVTRTEAPDAHDLLDIEDVSAKRVITTRLLPSITIGEENAAAGLEVISRFCIDPRWLIYLPPTMSPSETSARDGLLEHPDEAMAHFRRAGVTHVVVEEKHMGSRAVVVVCRDAEAAMARFGIGGVRGVIYTRTGRAFFADTATEQALLGRLADAMTATGFWARFSTDWACLDAELMPWSAKALALIEEQYAPVGTAAIGGLGVAIDLLAAAQARGVDAAGLQDRFVQRRDAAFRYDTVWRRYAWAVSTLEDLKLAPFHLLATEGAVHDDHGHAWHMRTLGDICAADAGILLASQWREIELADEEAVRGVTQWWDELTETGGEGAVFKPSSYIARGAKGLLQPALKVRGREYLRMIYGAEYTLPGSLQRLRDRGLSRKRGLALREFALGLEARPRMRLRCARPGKRAGRSETLMPRLAGHP
jgi:protein phosphatase